MKKIIAVNAGPRTGWNTDQLIRAAAEGAKETGAEIEYIDLFKLAPFTGCVSCFACKREKSYGKCAHRDSLTDVLEKIRNADGLIIGSPNYLGTLTASFKAIYERLVFQYLTYNNETPCCNERKIPVILIMTTNCPEEAYEQVGYTTLLDGYQNMLSKFIGPTEVLYCGNTLQVNDYSLYNWTRFNPEEKKKYHDETFRNYLDKAAELGRKM